MYMLCFYAIENVHVRMHVLHVIMYIIYIEVVVSVHVCVFLKGMVDQV